MKGHTKSLLSMPRRDSVTLTWKQFFAGASFSYSGSDKMFRGDGRSCIILSFCIVSQKPKFDLSFSKKKISQHRTVIYTTTAITHKMGRTFQKTRFSLNLALNPQKTQTSHKNEIMKTRHTCENTCTRTRMWNITDYWDTPSVGNV